MEEDPLLQNGFERLAANPVQFAVNQLFMVFNSPEITAIKFPEIMAIPSHIKS